jgi:ABC-type branched-subunit amino acid transport system ATPase component/ABC-type branched-subunit amino acid transport system permease subunit
LSLHLEFLLLGLANGAVFAALGLALTVTYRSSGVMNFATSTMALFTAYVYAGLRDGDLVLLIPGLPARIDLGARLTLVPAILVSLVIAALLGLFLYVAVFRPLRHASATAKAVASLGVMVVMTGVIVQRQGTDPPPVRAVFAEGDYEVLGATVTQDRVWFAVSVVLVAVGIWALTRFTRFGLNTRAVAESERGAVLSGLSPDRIAALNWMLSAVVCGVAGILISSILQLLPIQYALIIVPALATALLGGFERVGPVVVGGLAIGMLQSEMGYLRSQHEWLPSSGLAELVPLALILLVLVVRTRPLPSRGVILGHDLARAPRPRHLARTTAIATALAAIVLVVLSGADRAAFVTSLIFAVIALSYVVVTGYTGQISLAQLTLAGVAGFILGPLTTTWRVPLFDVQLPFPIAPIVAALGATVIGVAFGLPAVRVRGLQLAVVTLAFAVAVEAIWFRNSDFVTSSGFDVDDPTLFGWDLGIGVGLDYPRIEFAFLVLAVLVAAAVGVARLRTSRLGSAMLAVRANERSAAAAGVNVAATKLIAFAIGAFLAGLGGSLLAYKQGNVTFDTFTVMLGLGFFATAYMAGITSVSGAVIAGMISANGIVFAFLGDVIDIGEWFTTISGIGLILTVIANPEGIAGKVHEQIDRVRNRADADDVEPSAATGPSAEAAVLRHDDGAPTEDRDTVLALDAVSVRYRGVLAVHDVSFTVPAGSIIGLIGPNGAGKTTLLDAISGFTPATGAISLADADLGALSPHRRSRRGIGRTFQSLDLYDDLTVAENIVVGTAALQGSESPEDVVADVTALLGLTHVSDRPVGELSQGTRQLVSIGRALAGRPKLLLLDEPAAGLDTNEGRWLGARLRQVADRGTAVLLVDHDMQLVLDLCDELRVLDFGSLIASGRPEAVRRDPKVRTAYLGETFDVAADEPTSTPAEGVVS